MSVAYDFDNYWTDWVGTYLFFLIKLFGAKFLEARGVATSSILK